MDPARWEHVQNLFHEALDLRGMDQHAFLQAACAGDRRLMADVLAMLAEDARGESLLDDGVAQLAHRVVGPTAAPWLPGAEFGPYRIKEVLGEGGMGVVYLAQRSDLGSLAAIKVLRDAWLSPARRERFLIEQRTLAQLVHPFIARLYDADTLADGTPWFAMEYVEGVPLTGYCRTHASSIRERLELFRSVCESVQHAHLHAVIHRDLKPSNILVKADGTVRLLDFGIAKQLETPEAPLDQTRTALRLMTPAYAAPEQIRGEAVGVYTDVYALGVILYELLAGRLPMHKEPDKPGAGADLDVLCLTAMHKDPQRRYRSVEALMRDIDHYRTGEPLEARPDSLRYRLGKFLGRHRRSVAAAAAVLAAVIGLVAFFTVRLAIARNLALDEAARTQRIQRFMLNLFGDQTAGPADSLRVVTLLDRGVAEARALDREPAVQAELYQTLASIYQKLGKLDRADALLDSALERRRALYGRDHRDIADNLIALGLLRVDQARLPEAERLVRDGLAMSRRTLAPNHPAVARATTALGTVLDHRGNYRDAITVLEEAVRLESAPGALPADLAASLSELANARFYTGQYAISDALNRRVLAMHREIYGAGHPMVADNLMNLDAIQLNLGHYTEAERFARQALDIYRSWYGNDHPETASALTFVGQALVLQGRYDEAEGMLRQALVVQEHVYGMVHPHVATALNELASLSLRRGKLDEAEAGFRRAAEIYRAVYGDRHYQVAIALANVASVYLQRKEYARAERLFEEVIERYRQTLGADHLNTGIAQIKLGRALVRQQKYAEAETHILAGYAILSKQSNSSVSWLKTAREDLAAVYEAGNQPEKAAKYRAELAQR